MAFRCLVRPTWCVEASVTCPLFRVVWCVAEEGLEPPTGGL